MGHLAVLRRSGAFPWIVIAMLALGIGATTAMFSIVHGVLLQPLDFHDPGQLVLVGERVPQVPGSEKFVYFDTPAAFFAWRRQATDFSGLSALQGSSFTLTGAGEPRLLHGARVTSNFFDVIGARPELGRLFVTSDETDTSRPMVITDALWRSAFGADPGAIGRTVGSSGRTATIVGVLPAAFQLSGSELGPMLAGMPTEYFAPLHLGPGSGGGNLTAVFSNFNYTVLGRLRPGVTREHALAQLNVIQAELARSAPEKLSLYAELTTVRDYAVAGSRQALWLLLAGVGAVLLVVCVNLGGLWTTRLADQRREWAIRSALGAAPGRLVRQILGESVVLALIGGGLGVASAVASLRALVALAPPDIPRLNEVQTDWRVLGFGLLLAVAAGLLTGVVPALRLSRSDPQGSLKAGASAVTADRASLRSRKVLIGVQAALSTMLLSAAALLGLSFYHLVTRPTGFSAERALVADIVLNAYTDAQRDRLLGELPSVVVRIPGVTAVGLTSHLPLEGETWIDGAGVPGRTYTPAERPHVNVRFVSPGYFVAMGIPLVAGRDLVERDRPAGWPPKSDAEQKTLPGAVVISRATARALWPSDEPRDIVGRKMIVNGESPTVVGIAADALDGSLTAAPPSVVYEPYWHTPPYSVSLVVGSTLPAAALTAPLRAAIWQLIPDAPIPQLRSLSDFKSTVVAPQRYQLNVLLLFAGVALLLAAMGVYALVAHTVARRRKELALRIAIGASSGDLWSLVLRQALTPVACGVAAGLIAALASGRALANLLFEIQPTDPTVLATVGIVVMVAAAAACLFPARRATRTDPTLALRAE